MSGSREPAAGKLLAIASGRGGAGKTTVALNLALALSAAGRRVLLIDADMGLANTLSLLGLRARLDLGKVLEGAASLDEAMIAGPSGLSLLDSGAGLEWLRSPRREPLLDALRRRFDDVLVDTPAALALNVALPLREIERVLVLITPEQTAVTDGFTLIKAIAKTGFAGELAVAVNMARDEAEAESLCRRFQSAISRFGMAPVQYWGSLPQDKAVTDAAMESVPALESRPDSPFSLAARALARRLFEPTHTPLPGKERERAPEVKELVYALLDAPGFGEASFRELLGSLESIYRGRFGRNVREPLGPVLEALEADAVPEEELRVLARQLQRRLYGEPLEDRIAPLLRDLLTSVALSPDRWQSVREVLEEVHWQQTGQPLSPPGGLPELADLTRELARQRPELEALRASYAKVALALAVLEARLRDRTEGMPGSLP